jgi:hypothetical protein
MRLLFLSILYAAASLGAQELLLLDEIMSKEDQKKTGVIDLKPNQKIALENWLNKNCQCTGQAKSAKTEALFLAINVEGGKKIQLSDGSLWEIDPRDYSISATWLSPMPIKLAPSYNRNFPMLLVNKNTGVSVKARRSEATEAPPQTEQSNE